jgi:hypothetical protein
MFAHVWKRFVSLTCLAGSAALFVFSCSEARPLPPKGDDDAGAVSCDVGTSGCACDSVTGCRVGLLCISGKCLPTEGGQGGVPNDSNVPDLPGYGGTRSTAPGDGGTSPAPEDASVSDASVSDASVSDASLDDTDTGAPVEPPPGGGGSLDAAGGGDAS